LLLVETAMKQFPNSTKHFAPSTQNVPETFGRYSWQEGFAGMARAGTKQGRPMFI